MPGVVIWSFWSFYSIPFFPGNSTQSLLEIHLSSAQVNQLSKLILPLSPEVGMGPRSCQSESGNPLVQDRHVTQSKTIRTIPVMPRHFPWALSLIWYVLFFPGRPFQKLLAGRSKCLFSVFLRCLLAMDWIVSPIPSPNFYVKTLTPNIWW